MADSGSSKRTVFDRIESTGLIAVIRGADADTIVRIADALVAGGVRVLEVTADTDGAMELIRDVSSTLDDDVSLGVGTVLDSETAQTALRAGAEFVVTPSFDSDVVTTANRYGALAVPGVFTPTEAIQAYEAGADLLKVFPAVTGGPDHISALKGPLGQVPLVPTGGITLENVDSFIAAGATAVGVGSGLVDHDAIATEEFDELTDRAQAFRTAIADARTDRD